MSYLTMCKALFLVIDTHSVPIAEVVRVRAFAVAREVRVREVAAIVGKTGIISMDISVTTLQLMVPTVSLFKGR